jgi:hypothetical protein
VALRGALVVRTDDRLVRARAESSRDLDTRTARQPAELERLGHVRIAEGHAMLAQAAALRVGADSAGGDWIPVTTSPLGKRRTLELARAGAIESAKIGRKIVVRASSLLAFIETHARGLAVANDHADDDEEDLLGGPTPRPCARRRGRRSR